MNKYNLYKQITTHPSTEILSDRNKFRSIDVKLKKFNPRIKSSKVKKTSYYEVFDQLLYNQNFEKAEYRTRTKEYL